MGKKENIQNIFNCVLKMNKSLINNRQNFYFLYDIFHYKNVNTKETRWWCGHQGTLSSMCICVCDL